MTEIEAQKLVHSLLAAYPATMARHDEEGQRYTRSIYRRMLLDLDTRSAAAAIQRLLSTSKYMPSVAEVRASVLEAEAGCARPAGDAWGDIVHAIRRFGVHQTPAFDDANTAHVVRSMGWVALCSSENQIADRARFIQLYEQLTTVERHELQVPADVRRTIPVLRGPTQIGAAIQNLLTANIEPMTDEEHAEFRELARRIADNPDAAAEAEHNREAG